MPTLDWIGKNAVVNHHRQVPYRLLQTDEKLSAGDPDAGNLLVQGDNLEALKALLPYYAGQVKCIYIDPPYNTGNEGWVYNDNVNSPEIRKWLDKTVGKEAEDLSRHDKWLCMMYPRLCLLREFMLEDGAIFVSIDDNEVHSLRMLMDEIFGANNFIATIIWQKVFTLKNSAKYFSDMHDYIVVYAKCSSHWNRNLLPRTSDLDGSYSNPDNDPRGPWTTNAIQARNFYSAGQYKITSPNGKVFTPPRGTYWRVSEENFSKLNEDNRVWWGAKGNSIPRIKKFLSEAKKGVVPSTLWLHKDAGQNAEAKTELRAILHNQNNDEFFVTPKPVKLLKRIIEIATDKDSIVLDSFAGSGTTAHAVIEQNKLDGGNRRVLSVEIDESISKSITSQRLKNLILGYQDSNNQYVEGIGSGFKYCNLGSSLFDEHGNIATEVRFVDLARHVYFTETGVPIPKQPRKNCPLLGVYQGTAFYLLYNGVLGDKRPDGGNVLTSKVLADLPDHPDGDGPKVIYGEACRIGAAKLKALGIEFKQLPYQIKTD